ncbi:MFS transporter [Hominifimenecus sp. rT4P-3]|uniref:MFS transporter n=1 Tax=Hominifimenecus sp. rT4P-3 TaxID=3242979 RepID=UPI003DA2E881
MTKVEKLKKGLIELFTRNLILIILVRCGVSITDQMINGVQGTIGDSLGVSAALLGILTSVYSIVKLVTRVPAGTATDHSKKRNVIVFGILVKIAAMLCYGLAVNPAMFAIARVLQGFSSTFLGVVIPAIFGITLKKESMGFAFAVYSAMEVLCQNLGRPIGLSIYNSLGQSALGIAISVALLALLGLAMLMDYRKIEDELAAVRASKPDKKKSIFDGFMPKALPICIPIAIPMIVWAADGIYFPSYTDSLGINPTTMLYIAGLVASAMAFVTPIMSNIIGAKLASLICYGCRVVACFIIGIAMTTSVMTGGVVLNAVGECYDVPLMLLAMQIFPKTEFGAFYATLYLCMDVSNIIAGLVAAPLASFSYSVMYYVLGGIMVVGMVMIVGAVNKASKMVKENKSANSEA